MSDRQTMAPEVVQILVDNHRKFLAFLERRVQSREAAEDILQSAMARGLERGGAIDDDERVVAWFYRLLRNALVDHYRRLGAERRALEHHETEAAALGEVGLAPDPALERVICECMQALLPAMNPRYAGILENVDLGEETIQGFSERNGVTPNNTRVLLHRARGALRTQLQRMCGTCADHGCLDCRCNARHR